MPRRCLHLFAVIGMIALAHEFVSALPQATIVSQVENVLFATPDGRSLVSVLSDRLSGLHLVLQDSLPR